VTLRDAIREGVRLLPDLVDDPLVARLAALAAAEGANTVRGWPGLTIRRCCAPGRLGSAESALLTFAFIARADDGVAYLGDECVSGSPAGVVTAAGFDVDVQITAASERHPVFYCTLCIDPQLVRSISTSMYPLSVAGTPTAPGDLPSVFTLDHELNDTVVGFLDSLLSSCDRRVLAPIRMSELVYRLLQRDGRTLLSHRAADQLLRNPIAAVLRHIADHLAEPLSVEALAVHAHMSPSAFSRTFREATGQPPYQYIKDRRLDRARRLLEDRRLAVSAVAGAVGYGSVSHFIKEFQRRYGNTPGEYGASLVVHSSSRALT